jgi:hypothetical protein
LDPGVSGEPDGAACAITPSCNLQRGGMMRY